jgi:hypothetical protein
MGDFAHTADVHHALKYQRGSYLLARWEDEDASVLPYTPVGDVRRPLLARLFRTA